MQADGIRAFVCVPIRSAGGVLGTVSMGRQTGEPFTAEDVRMLEVTAAHLGVVLDRSGDATSPSAEIEPGREPRYLLTAHGLGYRLATADDL